MLFYNHLTSITMSEQEARATALTKEFEDDIVAIEQDEDNDATARDTRERVYLLCWTCYRESCGGESHIIYTNKGNI